MKESNLCTVGPQITLFCSTLIRCNIDKMPQELSSCLNQLAYSKVVLLYVISFNVAELIKNVK